MARKKNQKNQKINASQESLTHNPFSSLGTLLGHVEPVSKDQHKVPEASKTKEESAVRLEHCGRIVIRRERKGRGGKTVTTISGAIMPTHDLQCMLIETLKKSLGCGAHMEDDVIVLQGPLGDRVANLLRSFGARQCIVNP